ETRSGLLHPGDELTAAGMSIVGDQSWPVAIKLIKRQTDLFRVKLGIVEKCQFPKPPKFAASTRKVAQGPIRNGDPHDAMFATSVEDDSVHGMCRCYNSGN